MATTNLISKSLGDVLTQSGNGEPNHIAPLGSIYSDKDTGIVWRNTDGGSTWELLQTVSYGEAYVQNNQATGGLQNNPTTISSSNVWTASSGNFTEGTVKGFSASTQNLTLLTGYDGDYEVRLDATLTHIAGSPNYEVGISVNNADPISGTYGGTFLNSTQASQHVGVQSIITLTGGTTLSVDIKNLTDTSNVYLEHLQLFARKVR
jgi:hypothetical protein